MLPVYFFFLTGAYFVLTTPHFNTTTPGLDSQLFKSLITASSSSELGSSQHYSDSLILERFVDPPCLWNKAIICLPELSAAPEQSHRMKRRAQLEAIEGQLVNCGAKSQLLWQLYAVLQCKCYYDSSSSVPFTQVIALDILDKCKVFPRDWWFVAVTFPTKKTNQHTSRPKTGAVCRCLTAQQHKVDPCYYVQPCRADDF